MLSAVLRSETAVKVSIRIMEAFVAMRRFLQTNAQIFQRLDMLEMKQIETDKKVDQILTAIDMKKIEPKQGIFFTPVSIGLNTPTLNFFPSASINFRFVQVFPISVLFAVMNRFIKLLFSHNL
jgi:hypothetical protein